MLFSNQVELDKFLKKSDLDLPRFQKILQKIGKNCIKIKTKNNSEILKNRGNMSKVGGNPSLPVDFEIPENHIFLCQFDLQSLQKFYPEEIANSNFPKSGLLSIFIQFPDLEYYSRDIETTLLKPNLKVFHFENLKLQNREMSNKQVKSTKIISKNVEKIEFPKLELKNGSFDEYFAQMNRIIMQEKTENKKTKLEKKLENKLENEPIKIEFELKFAEIVLDFEKSLSFVEYSCAEFDQIFESIKKTKNFVDYETLCDYYDVENEKNSLLFGFDTNIQSIQAEDYKKIQKYYQNKDKIVHLLTFQSDYLDLPHYYGFGSISIFIVEKDLFEGKFEKVWIIPFWD